MARISPDVMNSFITETTNLLDDLKQRTANLRRESDCSSDLEEILNVLHTIRGNAHTFNFTTVEKLSRALEDVCKGIGDGRVKPSNRLEKLVELVSQKIKDILKNIEQYEYDDSPIAAYISYCEKIESGELVDANLMEQDILNKENLIDEEGDDIESTDGTVAGVQSVRIKLARINEIIVNYDGLITREFRLKRQVDDLRRVEEETGLATISKIRKQLATDIETLETQIFSVQQQIFDLRMLPLSMALNPLKFSVPTNAEELGKHAECDIEETKIALDKDILEELSKIVAQLVEDMLIIGIEKPEDRTAAGKDSKGKISISASHDSSYVELCIKDDGMGFDYDEIRSRAIVFFPEKAEEIERMSEKEIATYLFMPGLAKKAVPDEFKERYIGLDLIRSSIENIKGKISVESEFGKGMTFRMKFPFSLATLQGLFVNSAGRKLLLPSQHLVDIVYREKSQFITLQNQTCLQFNDEIIPIYSLASLFNNNEEEQKTETCNIVVAEYMEQKVGILVDDVLRHVSLVVKPLPDCFSKFSILQGIVFDEHYAIVPILHVPDIITRFKALRSYEIKKYEARTYKRDTLILVADGSETTRQIERGALVNSGFVVDTAEDGIAALDLIKERRYDLIISGAEMPRMDGAILLNNIRRNETTKNTPVIIVLPLKDDESIAEFKKNGANAFIIKSDFNRNTMISTVKELLNG